jgi:flavin-dependent dehydrogenase
MRADFDVAVIGGGPAGAAAAAELAGRGLAVVLLERDAGAPNRLCGEFLSPDGVASLEALGGSDILRGAAAPAVARWSVAAGEREVAGRFAAAGAGISRRRLDPGLRAVAARRGADVREGCRVTAVEPGDGGRRVVRLAGGDALDARAVIGATGRSARVPGLREPPAGAGRPPGHVALKAHFGGRNDGAVRVFALRDLYVGVSPVDGGAVNVCFLARRAAFERAGRSADALLAAEAVRNPRFRAAWSGLARAEPWVSAAGMDWGRRAPAGPAGPLAGDAAAQIAPFLGEGMSMAMESGRLAARWTAASLAGPGAPAAPDCARAYAREWRRRFGGRLRTGRALHGLLLRPRAAAVAVRALALLPGAADRIVRATRAELGGECP